MKIHPPRFKYPLFFLFFIFIKQTNAQSSFILIQKTNGFYEETQYIKGTPTQSISIAGIDDIWLTTYAYQKKEDTTIKISRSYRIQNNHRIPPYEITSTMTVKNNLSKFKVTYQMPLKDSGNIILWKSKWTRKNTTYPPDIPVFEVIKKNKAYRALLDTTLFETTKYYFKNDKIIKKESSKNDTSFVYSYLLYQYDEDGFLTKKTEINRGDTNWVNIFYRGNEYGTMYSIFSWPDLEKPIIRHYDTTYYHNTYGDSLCVTYRSLQNNKPNYAKECYNTNGQRILFTKSDLTIKYRYNKKNRLIYSLKEIDNSGNEELFYQYKKRRKKWLLL